MTPGAAQADETQARLRELIKLAKEQGYLTFDDLNEALPDDPRQPLRWASEALDLVQLLEDQMSVYRPHTELSQLNRTAAARPVSVEPRLFALLCCAREL